MKLYTLTNFSTVKILLVLLPVNIFWLFKFYKPAENVSSVCRKQRYITQPAPTYGLNGPQLTAYIDIAPKQEQSQGIEAIFRLNETATFAFNDIDFSYGRWDNQLLYKIKDFAAVGEQYADSSESSLVCLATQSSVERLYSLPQVSANWNGPISVALFTASNEEFAVVQYFVTYLRLCFPNIRANASFHIMIPRDYENLPRVSPSSFYIRNRFNCQYPEKTLRSVLKIRTTKTIQWRLKNIYPQNHMRNLARKGCQSKYVFLTDIDVIPSRRSVPQLNNFFKNVRCAGNCAYVIPTFEIDVRVQFPRSKECLFRLVKKGLARPFHEKVFIYNQYATNFTKWLSNQNVNETVHISHNVTNFEFLYEPFYIALDNVPIHDERFTGYGFTRNSQVYEMYIAGYNFFVLSPVFTCHWGLQRKQTRPAWREQQNNANRKKFDVFKSEILARYKNDPRFSKSKRNNS